MTDGSRTPGRIAFTLLLLVCVALVVGFSFSLGRTARIFPLIVAAPALVLLLLQLGQDLWPRLGKAIPFLREQAIVEMELPDDLTAATEAHSSTRKPTGGMSEALVFAWLGGLTAAVYFLHYLIVAPVFTVAFLRFQAKASWRLSLGVAGVMWLIIYLLFYRLLRIDVF